MIDRYDLAAYLLRHCALWALGILAALFASVALAEPECYPWDSNARHANVSTQPPEVLDFLAAEGTKASFVATWFCCTAYQCRGEGFMGWKANLTPDWMARLNGLITATKAERDALWRERITCPDTRQDTPECRPFHALRPIFQEQLNASRPPPIIWRVRTNGTNASRPVFRVTNGVRNTTAVAGVRVAVGDTCDGVRLALEESGGAYLSVAGRENVATAAQDVIEANVVALCARAN